MYDMCTKTEETKHKSIKISGRLSFLKNKISERRLYIYAMIKHNMHWITEVLQEFYVFVS